MNRATGLAAHSKRSRWDAIIVLVLASLLIVHLAHLLIDYLSGEYVVIHETLLINTNDLKLWSPAELLDLTDQQLRADYPKYRSRLPVMDLAEHSIVVTALVRSGASCNAFPAIASEMNRMVDARRVGQPGLSSACGPHGELIAPSEPFILTNCRAVPYPAIKLIDVVAALVLFASVLAWIQRR